MVIRIVPPGRTARIHLPDLPRIVHQMLDHLRTPDHVEAADVPIVVEIDIVEGDVDARDVADSAT